jgi:hypothetical protein
VIHGQEAHARLSSHTPFPRVAPIPWPDGGLLAVVYSAFLEPFPPFARVCLSWCGVH